MAVGFYRFVKLLEYETANPGQDFNEHEAEVFEFDEENAATGADVIRPNPVLPSNSNLMLSRSQSQQVGGMSLVGNRTSTFGAGSMYGAGNNRDSMYGGNRTLAGSPDRPVSGGGTTSGTTHPMNPLGPVDGSNEKLPFDEGGRMESGRPTYSKNDDKGSASTG
jgi:aquaporin related protein